MNEHTAGVVALWGGAILTLSGIIALLYKGARFLDGVARLVRHELNHNGGSSMKDDTKLARVVSEQTLDTLKVLQNELANHVIEGNAYMLGLERELGSITTRIKTLEESDDVQP